MSKLQRDIWRMVDGSWGAETQRNGVGVGVRFVSLPRAVWHVLTVRRPDEFTTPRSSPPQTDPQRRSRSNPEAGS